MENKTVSVSSPEPAGKSRESSSMEQIINSMKTPQFILFLVVVVLYVVGGILNPNFMGINNQKILTRDTAILAIGAIGVGFTILTGGIDLSVGSIVGFAGVMSAYFMMNMEMPIMVSIILTLVLGILLGLVHGLFVTKFKMHGFLITLVTMGAARGFCLVITNSFPITGLPEEFNFIGQGYYFDLIPVPVVIALVVAAITFYLLRFTYIGRQIYAAGGNIEAARFSGVNVDARVILCYIVSVVCASIVGMIQAARMSLGHPGAGEGFELQAITACILGGVSFMGGEGGVIGILIGSLIMGTLMDVLIMVNVNPYWHKIAISIVLLLAVTFDYLRRMRRD